MGAELWNALAPVLLPALGAAATVLATRYGIKIPWLIAPPAPSADREATDFFDWVVKVDSGNVSLDAYDRSVLLATKPVFDRIMLKVSPAPPPVPAPAPQPAPQFPQQTGPTA